MRRRFGVTFRELAQETGIREGTLRVWQQRERAAKRSARFVEVVERGETAAPFEVELASGRRLRVPAGFDEAALLRLLAALERRC
jgi:hypothetical protein